MSFAWRRFKSIVGSVWRRRVGGFLRSRSRMESMSCNLMWGMRIASSARPVPLMRVNSAIKASFEKGRGRMATQVCRFAVEGGALGVPLSLSRAQACAKCAAITKTR